jgi:hypothetical protein
MLRKPLPAIITSTQIASLLDKQEVQKGEKLTCQIEGVIRVASVHITIFSTNYAESNWCLDELLLLMLESILEKRSTILSVFFCVKPSELHI